MNQEKTRTSNHDLIIRAAERSDAAEVDHLYKQSIRCNKRGFIQDFGFHGSLWKKAKEWRAAGGELLVGRVSREIAGIGALAPADSRVAEICKLHVAERFQRRGIGRAIVLALIDVAEDRGFERLVLHVTRTQQSAIRLYERLGFSETERVMFATKVFGAECRFETVHMTKPLVRGMNSVGGRPSFGTRHNEKTPAG